MNTRTDTAMDWLKPLLMALLMIGLLASFWLGARLIKKASAVGRMPKQWTVTCNRGRASLNWTGY